MSVMYSPVDPLGLVLHRQCTQCAGSEGTGRRSAQDVGCCGPVRRDGSSTHFGSVHVLADSAQNQVVPRSCTQVADVEMGASLTLCSSLKSTSCGRELVAERPRDANGWHGCASLGACVREWPVVDQRVAACKSAVLLVGDVHFTTIAETVSIVTKVIQKAGVTELHASGVLCTVARGEGSVDVPAI